MILGAHGGHDLSAYVSGPWPPIRTIYSNSSAFSYSENLEGSVLVCIRPREITQSGLDNHGRIVSDLGT